MASELRLAGAVRLPQGLFVAGALALATLFVPALVQVAAAQTTEPSASEKETARALMREGDAHFDAARFEEALKAYAAADAIMHVPTTGLSLGKAQESLGLWVEARDTWLTVNRYPERAGEPAPFTRARQEAARLASGIASRIPTFVVSVAGVTSDTKPVVSLDGTELTVWTVPNRANPGEHQLQVSAEGYIAETRSIVLDAGQQHRIDVRLQPEPARAVAARPEGSRSENPREAESVPPLAAERRADTASEPSRWPMWVGFGIGALGVTAGSYFGLSSLSTTSDLKKECPDDTCPRESQGEIDDATFDANVANVGFAVGALGMGFGLWQFFTLSSGNDEAAESNALLRLGVSPGGVRVKGTF